MSDGLTQRQCNAAWKKHVAEKQAEFQKRYPRYKLVEVWNRHGCYLKAEEIRPMNEHEKWEARGQEAVDGAWNGLQDFRTQNYCIGRDKRDTLIDDMERTLDYLKSLV